MKIALDARWIFPEISGIGEYTRELIRAFARDGGGHQFVLLFKDPALLARTRAEVDAAPHLEWLQVPYGVFSPWNQLALPRLLRQRQIALYHSTNYMMPLPGFSPRSQGPVRAVVTIHDVIPLLFPDHAPRSRKARVLPLYRALMRSIGRRATLILTDSASSSRDIVRELAIPSAQAAKVRTVYCGVAARFTPPPTPPKRTPGDPRTLLYVGRSDPYKNITGAIRAFAEARTRLPFPLQLTIAGGPDPRYPEAQALSRSLGLEPHIRWTGYLADAELVRLYQESDALVHCSRYEGFGLQVLEAMACGLPVICSNAGSLPEVVGDAALQAGPDDTRTFAAHMVTVLTQPDLAARLRRRGLARAARFTWQQTAAQTLRAYDDAGAA